MAKVLAPKNGKVCVLCANWNGSVGSTTIEAKPGGNFLYDRTESQSCFKKGVKTLAWATCPNFRARY